MSSAYIRAMRNRCLRLAREYPEECYFFIAAAMEWQARLNRHRACH